MEEFDKYKKDLFLSTHTINITKKIIDFAKPLYEKQKWICDYCKYVEYYGMRLSPFNFLSEKQQDNKHNLK